VDLLLDRLRETYAQRAVSIVAAGGNLVASAGPDPCADVDSADTAVEVGDHEFWMLMAGRTLTARDRRVLGAVAEQAVAMLTQRQ
jgi:two-component system sensor histidine kinase KdpD